MTVLRGSSINSVGMTGYPHSKEWSWTLTSYHIKINSIWIKDIYIKLKLKNLEVVNLHDLGLCKGFSDMTQKLNNFVKFANKVEAVTMSVDCLFSLMLKPTGEPFTLFFIFIFLPFTLN